jgi:hypothetical protein
MYRKLTDTEIALIRLGIWPCCGEKEVEGGPRGTLMRNLKCPGCGTIVNIPSFVTTTENMRQMCEMIHQPGPHYDPEAVARRVNLDPVQIARVNTILSSAPYEARNHRRQLLWDNLRWKNLPSDAKWVFTMVPIMVAGLIGIVVTAGNRGAHICVWMLIVIAAGITLLFRPWIRRFKGEKK